MIDKAHLCDKKVIFRFRDEVEVYAGVVKVVESDGFWIESPQLIGQMAADSHGKGTLSRFEILSYLYRLRV